MSMAALKFGMESQGFSSTRTPRDIEYDLFSRVTRQLGHAAATQKLSDAGRAIAKNSEIWSELAAAVADDENALPDQLRAGIISLAMFSIRHGQQVLNGKARIDALIDVNKSMMRGLRGSPG